MVGDSDTAEGFTHAFITGPDGKGMRDLGTLGGSDQLCLWHQRRWAGGGCFSHGLGALTRAFITGPDGMGMRDLGSLRGDFDSDGRVASTMPGRWWVCLPPRVGYSLCFHHRSRRDGYERRGHFRLGVGLIGVAGINEAGQVVGIFLHGWTRDQRAFITDTDGMGMRDLGTLSGGGCCGHQRRRPSGRLFWHGRRRFTCFHYRPRGDGYERPWHFRW